MFVFLESKREIANAHGKLVATFRREFHQRATKDIGYPGGRVRGAKVYTDGYHWFWSQDLRGRQTSNPRRLNWFGVFSERPGFGITVEINTAYEGRNDQTAGFFARDTNSGIIYLFHSGRVGGGTKGRNEHVPSLERRALSQGHRLGRRQPRGLADNAG